MEFWQDVVDYEKGYLNGEMYKHNEGWSGNSYFIQSSSAQYRGRLSIENDKVLISIRPNPNLEFSLSESFPIPYAEKLPLSKDYAIYHTNNMDNLKGSQLNKYNELTSILQHSMKQMDNLVQKTQYLIKSKSQ